MNDPRVSVFTPSHRPAYLDDCFRSLLRQTYRSWEWIVLLNDGADWPGTTDTRVKVHRTQSSGVGALKREACALAAGELLVELDHDDVLASTALERVVAAFDEHPEAGFVYSDTAMITAEGVRDDRFSDPSHGWTFRDTLVDGLPVSHIRMLEAFPHNLSYIWYSPNHVRAFRRDAYRAVGGYDASRDILDDQDLMCRLYQRTEFHHLPECLYLQRMHSENTQWQSETNARIQRETVHLYDQNVEANALAWAGRRRLLALDVGPPEVRPPGYGGLAGAGNASEPDDGRFPLPDQSVGVLRAVDVLHRLADPVAWFNEAHRVLAHGGLLLSSTPSTDGRAAFQDPLARSYFNENSFWYYTNREFTRYLPALSARFQESRLTTGYPSADDEESDRSYVTANLVALHDGPRQGGLLLS